MGKHRKKFGKGGKGKRAPRERTHKSYEDIVKENEVFEKYYKKQNCFSIEQFPEFLASMRTPLPAVFRITGYKAHAKQLLKNMKKTHFEEMVDLTVDDEPVKSPEPLLWYPDQLAWHTSLSRTQIRRAPQLEKFHRFLIAEVESGHITRQEAVSMIPPLLLDIQPHHKVLDMCAAPGSKTAQIVELLHRDESIPIPDGICVANDKDNKRCYMLVHQIQRLNSPSTIIVNHDAAFFPEIYVKDDQDNEKKLRYDRVLCDVPCSGDGTMRKNTDVWKNWSVSNSIYLHPIQLAILQRGLELLDIGGKVVYSTCSLNPLEDEAVVAAAINKCGGAVEIVETDLPGLKWCPGVSSWQVMDKKENWYEKFEEVPEEMKHLNKTLFPPAGSESMNLNRCMRVLPNQQDTGGFFICVLKKTKLLPWQKEITEEKQLVKDGRARKRARWGPGFKEDPFVFFTEEQNQIKEELGAFYGLDKTFPYDQLLTRTNIPKKKQMYFVSKLVKNIIANNEEWLKLINTGVRMFRRCENNQDGLKCVYRVIQDATECVRPFMSERVIPVKIDDVKVLLSKEQPTFSELSEEFREQIKTLDPGSLIFRYVPKEGAEVECELLLCAWKGNHSARLYLSKHERMHSLNLIAHPVPEYLLPNKNARRTRADNKPRGENDGAEEGEKESSAPNGDHVAAPADETNDEGRMDSEVSPVVAAE